MFYQINTKISLLQKRTTFDISIISTAIVNCTHVDIYIPYTMQLGL